MAHNTSQNELTLTLDEVCIAILRAFKTWEYAANISFREMNFGQDMHCGHKLGILDTMPTEEDGKPNIILGFYGKNHSDDNFDGKSGILGHAFYPGVDKNSGGVHFDVHENWAIDEGVTKINHDLQVGF